VKFGTVVRLMLRKLVKIEENGSKDTARPNDFGSLESALTSHTCILDVCTYLPIGVVAL